MNPYLQVPFVNMNPFKLHLFLSYCLESEQPVSGCLPGGDDRRADSGDPRESSQRPPCQQGGAYFVWPFQVLYFDLKNCFEKIPNFKNKMIIRNNLI
jgi:hypothetical protein